LWSTGREPRKGIGIDTVGAKKVKKLEEKGGENVIAYRRGGTKTSLPSETMPPLLREEKGLQIRGGSKLVEGQNKEQCSKPTISGDCLLPG